MSEPKPYCVYILACADGTLYTGITNDLERRLHQHQSGKGAKYVNSRRRPVKLVHSEGPFEDKGTALKREHQIKQLSKAEKQGLVESSQAEVA